MSFVLNPTTSRMVKIGGKKWRQLIREGIVENLPVQTVDKNQVWEAKDSNEAKVVKDIMTRKKIGIKKGEHLMAKGNKVISCINYPKQEDMADFTARVASRTIHKHMDRLSSDLEDAYENGDDDELGDFECKLKNLILQEMVSSTLKEKPNKTMKIKGEGEKKEHKEPDTEYELDNDYINADHTMLLADDYEGEDY